MHTTKFLEISSANFSSFFSCFDEITYFSVGYRREGNIFIFIAKRSFINIIWR